MRSLIDFLGLAAEKEKLLLHLEEDKKKNKTLDDQHYHETTPIVPVPVPEPTTVDHLQFFTKEIRRPRTNRKILGTMKVTEGGPLYDINENPDEVVDAEAPLSHAEVMSREKLLKKPMEVESSTAAAADDDSLRKYFDFFDEGKPGRYGIVIREPPKNQPEELPRNLLKRKTKNNCLADKEIEEAKAIKVLDHDVHRQPCVKAVETRESFLDLNQPPPEETAEEKEQEKNKKNKKRKGDSDDGRIKKKRSPFKKAVDDGPNPPPELPQEVMDSIRQRAQSQGRDNVDDGEVNLVIQKSLTASDLARQQNRLIYTKHQLRNKFLTDEEEKVIGGKDENNHHKVIEVPLIEPSTQVERVNFTKWIRGKNSESYVLNGYWKKVVNKNHLLQGQVVQLWAFRIGGKLHFALVVLPGEVNTSSTVENAEEKGIEAAPISPEASPKAQSSISPDENHDTAATVLFSPDAKGIEAAPISPEASPKAQSSISPNENQDTAATLPFSSDEKGIEATPISLEASPNAQSSISPNKNQDTAATVPFSHDEKGIEAAPISPEASPKAQSSISPDKNQDTAATMPFSPNENRG